MSQNQGTVLKFFYDNMLQSTEGTITATSTSTGAYTIDDVHNMLEVNGWKGASSATQNIDFDAGVGNTFDADYIAILGHNLFSVGSSVAVIHSTSGAYGGEEVTIFSTSVDADTVFLKEFTAPGAKRYWRVQINGASTSPSVNILSLGTVSTVAFIQPPFDPHGQKTVMNTNMTEGGFVAGIHTKYTERSISLGFGGVSTSLYSILNTWHENSGMKNFFMAWDTTNDSSAVYLVRPDGNFNNPINVDKFRNVTINLKGRKE